MKTAKIQRVAILDDGRFALFTDTKDSSWQYVYREACGVYWNQHLGCFHSNEPPRTWGNAGWYQHIISVVNAGLGLRMRLASDAIFDCDAPGFDSDILAAEVSVQTWIDSGSPPKQ